MRNKIIRNSRTAPFTTPEFFWFFALSCFIGLFFVVCSKGSAGYLTFYSEAEYFGRIIPRGQILAWRIRNYNYTMEKVNSAINLHNRSEVTDSFLAFSCGCMVFVLRRCFIAFFTGR